MEPRDRGSLRRDRVDPHAHPHAPVSPHRYPTTIVRLAGGMSLRRFGLLGLPWRSRGLVATLARREVLGRYRGSLLGVTWSFLLPLAMLGVYTFVFGTVLVSRWPDLPPGPGGFPLLLFAGLIPFTMFSELVQRAPAMVVSQPNLVKKVAFPLEILPWTILGAAAFHAAIALLVWLLAATAIVGLPPMTAVLAPLVLASLVPLCLGVSWFLAALGVYLRDIGQIVGPAMTMTLFLTPIFYPPTALPEAARALALLNPLAVVVEAMRDVLIRGTLPPIGPLVAHVGAGSVVAWAGLAFFRRMRPGFADVL